MEQIIAKEKKAEEEKIRAFGELSLSSEEKRLFETAQELIFFKADRKDILFKSYFQMRPLIFEIAKRLGISVRQARFLLPSEVESALLHNKTDKKLLDERYSFSVAVSENDSTRVYVGEKAKRFLETEVEKEEKLQETNELKGSCASPGYAKGIAKLILSPKDLPKMNQGDILISPATNPDIVPAMKKAAAIVTNTGGLTCHAAIVSRELGIPCVVGTKHATDILKDGDMIEVDATAGIVRRMKN